MNYKLPQELGQQVINYLQTKPFIEVNQLLAAILALEKLPDDKDK